MKISENLAVSKDSMRTAAKNNGDWFKTQVQKGVTARRNRESRLLKIQAQSATKHVLENPKWIQNPAKIKSEIAECLNQGFNRKPTPLTPQSACCISTVNPGNSAKSPGQS